MSRVVSARTVRRVRARANSLCEYCKIPEIFAHVEFEIDHIIARVHGGKDSDDNLAWACLLCNSRKGPNIASVDPNTQRRLFLFHPRLDLWPEHFRMSEGLIIPKSSKGRATVALLQVNSPEAFIFRRTIDQLDDGYAKLVVQRCI